MFGPGKSHGSRAILVLGRGLDPNGGLKPELVNRLEQALLEAQRQPDAVVVVTGGAVANAHPEAPAMRQWLVEHGVEARCVVVEDQARTTLENMENSVPILRDLGATEVTLVTERFHQARSKDLFIHALEGAHWEAKVKTSAAHDGLHGKARLRRMVREFKAWQKDRVNQVLLHSGRGLFFVGPQVLHAGEAEKHQGGQILWSGLKRQRPAVEEPNTEEATVNEPASSPRER
jgi:vancomycin permeability regulator SanA